MKKLVMSHALVIICIDIISLVIAGGLALMVRFEFSFSEIPPVYLENWFRFLPLHIFMMLAVFWPARMYHFVWRSVSARDVIKMIGSVLLTHLLFFIFGRLLGDHQPRSVECIGVMCELFLLVGTRCAIRFYMVFSQAFSQLNDTSHARIMLIGAGEAGRLLARELLTNARVPGRLCCVIDDDKAKWGKYLEGIPILGGRELIQDVAARERISQIILAIPTATAQQKKEILDICKVTGCRIRIVPGLYQLMNDDEPLASVKDVRVEDLLGREPVQLDMEMVDGLLRDKTVLVTGGGGSIGSELCRQIARHHPRQLIILDIYENNAYDIQQELWRTWGDRLNLKVEIASVRDKERIYEIFDRCRPDLVFHAAAHKHVPLMEECPSEAIKNNVFGTYHVVRAAEKYNVGKFVMISTDKAVNPTNVMGATKRFCEMILQSRVNSPTEYCAVRFGNVLGSNGSVVPLFERQIAEGGPVTITDKRIIRYFMTITESVQLVLEAGAMAKRSEIFVLDMGEPVKILDLAENMIRLSGKEPGRDIEIKEIGLRPGEKLYEELLIKSETLLKTENSKIFVEQQQYIDPKQILWDLEFLDRAVTDGTPDAELIGIMRGMVPNYRAPEEVNREAEEQRRIQPVSSGEAPAGAKRPAGASSAPEEARAGARVSV